MSKKLKKNKGYDKFFSNYGGRSSIRDNTGFDNLGSLNTGNDNEGDFNSGSWNIADYNSGSRNSGSHNSGDNNSGDFNSGHNNANDHNSGNYNMGDWNSGDFNQGCKNSGNWNSGNNNSGDNNGGDFNSGHHNIGCYNSGDWNKANHSSGCFNTEEPRIFLFNRLSDWTYHDWELSEARKILMCCPSNTLSWISEKDMTRKEKRKHPEFLATGGYLKIKTSDRQEWWNELSKKDKTEIFSIPNFNAKIFKKITGIDVNAK